MLLPRNFRGRLTLKTHSAAVTTSPGVTAAMTALGEEGRTRRAFIGEFRGEGEGERQVEDEAWVESFSGALRVAYVDEEKPAVGGLARLSRIFAGKK